MRSSELRAPLFRVVTAVVFVAAIALLRTQSVYASPHSGPCSEAYLTPVGCDEPVGGFTICWEVTDCSNVYDSEYPWDLCYCMNDDYCGWWPNGCT